LPQGGWLIKQAAMRCQTQSIPVPKVAIQLTGIIAKVEGWRAQRSIRITVTAPPGPENFNIRKSPPPICGVVTFQDLVSSVPRESENTGSATDAV
jgi:hypothetical protein